MAVMNVRTLSHELCTRIFAFYLLTKDEKTNCATGDIIFVFGPTLLAAAITQQIIIFVTTVFNETG